MAQAHKNDDRTERKEENAAIKFCKLYGLTCNINLLASIAPPSATCSSGPTVVMIAERTRPRQLRISSEAVCVWRSSRSSVDSVRSTRSRNIGPPESAIRA